MLNPTDQPIPGDMMAEPYTEAETAEFIEAYVEAMFWLMDEQYEQPDPPLIDHLDEQVREEISSECKAFIEANLIDLRASETRGDYAARAEWSPQARAGHDFYLTRNGHGAGFWDRGLKTIGERLSEAAKPYGDQSIWPADDGSYFLMH